MKGMEHNPYESPRRRSVRARAIPIWQLVLIVLLIPSGCVIAIPLLGTQFRELDTLRGFFYGWICLPWIWLPAIIYFVVIAMTRRNRPG